MLSFMNGNDLPGKAFTTSNPVWVAGVSLLASSLLGSKELETNVLEF